MLSSAHAMAALAAFVADLRDDDVPAATRQRATRIVADTVGVALRGSVTGPAARLVASRQDGDEAHLLAAGFPATTRSEAALLNAILTCSTELDEGTRPTGHPAMHLLPPVLAASQARRCSGRSFLTAFVAGYEVQARLQRAVRLRDRVHCHGNFGHAGVAAALALLEGRPAEAVLTAMNGAVALASATSYGAPYAGASMHAAAPSTSGSVGALAVRLAEAGYTAYDGAVDETFGRLLGTAVDADELTRGLGSDWAVDGGYTKFHSTCGHVHPVLDALVDALAGRLGPGDAPWRLAAPVDPDQIASVEVTVSSRAAELAHLPPPGSALSARFSIRFSTAAFLAHAHAAAEVFEQPALDDPRVRALAERVAIVADPELDRLFPELHRARVLVRFRDGTTATGSCDNPYGNPYHPASDADVRRKFGELAGAVMPAAEADLLWQRIRDCDRLDDVRDLTPTSPIERQQR